MLVHLWFSTEGKDFMIKAIYNNILYISALMTCWKMERFIGRISQIMEVNPTVLAVVTDNNEYVELMKTNVDVEVYNLE